jgi:diguanylate cyclase (GGDEF)-like protein
MSTAGPRSPAINWMVPVTLAERPNSRRGCADIDRNSPACASWARAQGLHPAGPSVDLPADAVHLAAVQRAHPRHRLPDGAGTHGSGVAGARQHRAGGHAPLQLVANGATASCCSARWATPGRPPVGVLALVLDAQSFVRQAVLRAASRGFDISLADVTARGAPLTLVGDPVRHAVNGDYTVQLTFGGRTYATALFTDGRLHGRTAGLVSWTVLTAGLLLTALLGALMLLTSGERAQIEAQVATAPHREARLQAILDNAGDAIVTVDARGAVVSANRPRRRCSATADAPARPAFTTLVPGHGARTARACWRAWPTAPPEERELDGIDASGEPIPLAVAVSHRSTCRRAPVRVHPARPDRAAPLAGRIHRLAHHDPLTGLENRAALGMRLEQQLAQARRAQLPLAVLFIDLDHFKKINDSLGHQAGDQLLMGASARMKDLLRDVDALARLGGDEFIIVLGGPLSPDSVSAVAVRLVASLQQPYYLAGITAHSGASVGVALFPEDGEDPTPWCATPTWRCMRPSARAAAISSSSRRP